MNKFKILMLFIGTTTLLHSCHLNKSDTQLSSDPKTRIDSLLNNSFVFLRKDLKLSYQLAMEADSLSRRINYYKGLARSFRSQSYNLYYSNQPELALELLNESEKIELNQNNPKGLASTYNVKAWLFKNLNFKRDALENYQKVISLQDSLITQQRKIISHNNIANIFTSLSQNDSALIHYNNALELSKGLKDSSNLAIIYTNLGNTQSHLNNNYSAKENYLKALAISQKINFSEQEAKVYNNLGALFYEIQKDSIALHYFKKSIEVKQKQHDSLALAKSYFNIVELYFQNQKYSEISDQYLQIAEHIFRAQYNIEHLSKIHIFKAERYKKNGFYLKSKKELEEAEILLETSSEITTKSHVYKKLAEILSILNADKLALKKYLLYNDLKDSILNENKIWRAAELEKKNLIKIKQNEISLLEKDTIIAHANALKNKDEKQNLLFSLGGAIVILILLTLLIVYFYRLRKTESQLASQQETLLKREFQNLVDEQELHIVNATLNARKKEKEVISKELHNNIGSLLTSAKFHFQSFDEDLLFSDISTKKLYFKTTNIIDNIIDEIRSLSHRFDKDAQPGFNLKNAVTEFLRKVDSKHLSVQTTIHGLDSFQNSDVSIFIFRALQELVNNVIKHSHAAQLIVYITRNIDGINIMVEDNGSGFDTSKKQKGIGLKNLNRQIKELNGECFIDSNPGRGTTININIPIVKKV